MTVREFREWLEAFPDQDAIVQIVESDRDSVSEEDFRPDANGNETWDYYDFRGNDHVKGTSPLRDKRFLVLGMKN
ncbi:MAG: hypothetical protein LC687_04050 [Actinobacteria bacterium]|nr:hypothetical protein [Actinomycetota bacterium]MCA1807009.1 hypothetical protein [Actinomycetota bacterium]